MVFRMSSCFRVVFTIESADSTKETKKMIEQIIKDVRRLRFKKAELWPGMVGVDLRVQGEYSNKKELLAALEYLAKEAEYVTDLKLILYR